MCGIAGILLSGKEISDETLKLMVEALKSRGPDAHSWTHCEKGLALLHTRLKVMDLRDEANQPMTYEDERYTLVFNGEIYNHDELRKQMEATGEIFKTTCDTEVLLRHLVLKGCTKDALAALNGMFAFAFHDKVSQSMWVARDRMGIKPLFYVCSRNESQNKFAFASNINALLKANVSSREVDVDGVSMYISFRSPLGTKTMFRDVKKLEPGHFLRMDTGTGLMEVEQYWDLPLRAIAPAGWASAGEDRAADPDEGKGLASTVRSRMQEAVELEMVADVPVCSYLSGGVDSSVITSLMQQRFDRDSWAIPRETEKKRVTTYTVGFKESNEFDYARKVATVCETNHKELLLSMSDYFETMVSLITEKGEPLGVPNEVALYLMSCLLKRDGFTVVLSGEGADEVFHGYGKIFRLGHDYERVKRFEAGLEEYQEFKDAYCDYNTDSFADFFIQRYSYVSLAQKNSCFGDSFKAESESQADAYAFELIKSCFDRLSHMPYQDQISYVMLKLHLPVLLHRCDTCTMATGVEARVPFVNQTVVDHVFQLPPQSKMVWVSDQAEREADVITANKFSEVKDVPKALLKEAFSSDLPHDTLYRKKVGFPIPLKAWFGGAAKSLVLACVDKLCSKRHLFDAKMIELAQHFSDRSSESDTYFLWASVNLELWYSLYIDGMPATALKEWVRQKITPDCEIERLPSLLITKSGGDLAAKALNQYEADGKKERAKVGEHEAKQHVLRNNTTSLGSASLIHLSKINERKLSENPARRKVVLFESGSFCPPHMGHLSLLENTKGWLEGLGIDVIAGYLSPHSNIGKKFGGIEPLTKEERCQLCDAICSNSPWIMCDSYRCFATIEKDPETENEFRKGPPAYLARDAIERLIRQKYGIAVEIWCLLGDDVVEMIQGQGFFQRGSRNSDLQKTWGHFTPVVCVPRSIASPCLELARGGHELCGFNQLADIRQCENDDAVQVYVCREEQYIKRHGLTGTSTNIRNLLDQGLPITAEMGNVAESLIWQLPGAISRLQQSVKTDQDKPKIIG